MSKDLQLHLSDCRAQLQNGVKSLKLELDSDTIDKFIAYLSLFTQWNTAYNLSAINDPGQIVSKHLLDSLSVTGFLSGNSIIDVGTGAGLPGIPLALALPTKQFALLDSNGKKTRFLYQVKEELQLGNITIINERLEKYLPESKYDGVISRAFTKLPAFVAGCRHLLVEGGRIWAMKGVFPQTELSELEKQYIVEDSFPLRVPGLNAERCLLIIKIA